MFALSLFFCISLNTFTPVVVNLVNASPVCAAAVANLDISVKAKIGGISFKAVDIIPLIVLDTLFIPSNNISSASVIDGLITSKLSAINSPNSFFRFSPSGLFNAFFIFVTLSLNSLIVSLAGLFGFIPYFVPID